MNKNSTIFAIFFILITYSITSFSQPNQCDDNQNYLDNFKLKITQLDNKSVPLTSADIDTYIIKPLLKTFSIDGLNRSGQGPECHGYTVQAITATRTLLHDRADEITPILLEECKKPLLYPCNPYNIESCSQSKDLNKIAAFNQALKQWREAAKTALVLINKPIDECLSNGQVH